MVWSCSETGIGNDLLIPSKYNTTMRNKTYAIPYFHSSGYVFDWYQAVVSEDALSFGDTRLLSRLGVKARATTDHLDVERLVHGRASDNDAGDARLVKPFGQYGAVRHDPNPTGRQPREYIAAILDWHRT